MSKSTIRITIVTAFIRLSQRIAAAPIRAAQKKRLQAEQELRTAIVQEKEDLTSIEEARKAARARVECEAHRKAEAVSSAAADRRANASSRAIAADVRAEEYRRSLHEAIDLLPDTDLG